MTSSRMPAPASASPRDAESYAEAPPYPARALVYRIVDETIPESRRGIALWRHGNAMLDNRFVEERQFVDLLYRMIVIAEIRRRHYTFSPKVESLYQALRTFVNDCERERLEREARRGGGPPPDLRRRYRPGTGGTR